MNRFIVANPRRCIGCKACEIACALAHSGTDVHTANARKLPFIPRLQLIRASKVTMPIQCRQCEDAPCAQVCSEGAIVQRGDRNLVIDERCIGCKKCMIACPFGAIDVKPLIVDERTKPQSNLTADGEAKEVFVTQKCDLCLDRADGPACAAVCPADAFVVVESALLRQTTSERRSAAARDAAQWPRLERNGS